MTPVLGSIWQDLMVAVLFGALGGFTLGLLQDRGLVMPYAVREQERLWLNLGFVGDIITGGVAALLIVALNPPDTILALITVTIPAGIGGSALLQGYIKDSAMRAQASRAEQYRQAAWDATRGTDIMPRLEQLDAADEALRRRWSAG